MSFEIVTVENNVTKSGATYMNGLQNRIKAETDSLQSQIDEIQPTDGDWVDLSEYLSNTDYLAIRPASGTTNFKPMARRIDNKVYFRGEIYCFGTPGVNVMELLGSVPEQFRPTEQFSTCGCTYEAGIPYNIFIDNSGNVKVSQSSNITVQNTYSGFQLSNLNGFLTD